MRAVQPYDGRVAGADLGEHPVGVGPGELDDVYEQALAVTDRPALVNVICSPTENCYPMWPAGLAIDSMVIEDPKQLERSTA